MKQLINELQKENVRISLDGDDLELRFEGDQLDPDLLNRIKANKQELIAFLKKYSRTNQSEAIQPVPKADKYPVSFAQKRLWVLSQFEGGSVVYNMPITIHLEEDSDIDAFIKSVYKVVDRHEVLRTVFKEDEEGELCQYVFSKEELGFHVERKDFRSAKSPADKATAYVDEDSFKPFDLENGPLLRASLLRTSDTAYSFYYNMHHIISDGWSMEILIKDIMTYYEAFRSGTEPQIEDLNIQYKDFSAWQIEQMTNEKYRHYKDFWINKLSGTIPVLDLPSVKQRPKFKTYNGQGLITFISPEMTNDLKQFAQVNGGSLFINLLTIWNVLLYRYTDQKDIVIGTPVAGRGHSDLENQIGFYVNTLPVRNNINPEETYLELYKRVTKSTLEDFSNQMYPFDLLVEELDLKRDVSRNPLFDQMLSLDITKTNRGFDLKSVDVIHDLGIAFPKFDLNIDFVEMREGMSFRIVYNTDIYEQETIERFMIHFKRLVAAALKSPNQLVGTLDYLTPTEKRILLEEYNNTEISYQKEQTFLDLLNKQILETPDATALVYNGASLSYAELDKRSNQLAHYLSAQGIQTRSVVALCVDRSFEMIIGILGILKCGATYLPLDASYPLERLDFILEDSGAKLVLTKETIQPFLPTDLNTLCFENPEIWTSSDSQIQQAAHDLPAYVIYTSGTTGKPKGVAIAHQNLFNFFVGLNDRFELPNADETWLAVTSMSFDISILEMLWTLTRGSSVVIQPDRPVALTAIGNMDFSLFYFAAQDEKVSENKYSLLLRGAKYADENGLKGIWVPERHFHSFGDQFPNPSIAAAAVAATTQNITIRSGSVVLPLHDPVRVAEEWSMVDNLSEGRVELSIASGWHPNDFVLAPEIYKNRHQFMRDGITTLQSFWKGDSITRKNGVGADYEFNLHPKPIQQELKIWITAAGSVETFKYAGAIGANLLTHLLGQNIDELKDKIVAYRASLAEHGYDPDSGKVALMLHTFVSDDNDYVKEVVEEPFKNYLRHSINLIKPMAAANNLDVEEDLEAIVNVAFKRFYHTSGLFGTPEFCFKRITELHAIGVNEIACLVDYGIDTDTVISNLEHLKRLDTLVNRSRAQYGFLSSRFEDDWSIPQLIQEHHVTHLQSTPSFVQELLVDEEGQHALQQIETLLIGGEALPVKLANELLDLRKQPIFNMYGPTETTIWSTIKAVDQKDQVTIGTPIANTQIYILDQQRQLCPIGVQGEIYIGGDGVSMGYIGRDDLNKEKFFNNPFTNSDKAKIYKTGDLGRWLPNGELDCLGRIDNQVKISGHRIELGEIEQVINQAPDILNSVVSFVNKDSGKSLIAYIRIKDGYNEELFRSFLKLKLPSYMIPSMVLILDEFPLTLNGKIDRKALPTENISHSTVTKYVAPRNDFEEKLIEILSVELKMKTSEIGINDNFFDLGMNSFKLIRALENFNKAFNASIKPFVLFEHTTVNDFITNVFLKTEQVEVEEIENLSEEMDEYINLMNE